MANTIMAFAISTPSLNSSSSYHGGIPSLFVSVPKYAIFQQLKAIPHLGFAPFSQWSGLKQLGISIPKSSAKMGGKGKCKGRGVYASLFGVGAPEALVIGVVALLVFGPKGLAEVARNLGKTLRAFQPTIRELQEVSREFKSSLEREIGLDEISNSIPRTFSSDIPRTAPMDTSEDSGTNIESKESPEDNSSPSESGGYTADEYLKVTQAQFEGALAQLRKEQEEEEKKNRALSESQTPSQVIAPSENPDIEALQESASVLPPGPSPDP
ncbi:sec-independent protein translocase protein TATB, chloroplastic isoform X2 [Sesamum indicum]|uniref:Sec-independent protein translocase protein TATB, chloroplastic isoform X2 n=1 Tax=Sesamum indicum TaxID=4182 RepID=A0A6I9TJU3_SESIN|nr:sec-independent protein translocase protein TATB, chloroplastic isoform X2 [Sesamum indicum]